MKIKYRSNKYKALNVLKHCDTVAVIGHISPDADAIASITVFADFIQHIFGVKRVFLYADTDLLSEKLTKLLRGYKINEAHEDFDCVVMIDAPKIERLGKYKEIFNRASMTICIDHHRTNEKPAKINIVESVSSSCELVYKIMKSYSYKPSADMLENIYAGIVTDTGNFSVGEYSSETFRLVAELKERIDTYKICNQYFISTSWNTMKALSCVIENAERYFNSRLLITHIDREEMGKYNILPEDLISISNRLATIDGVKISFFIEERNNSWHVGIRSDRNYDISNIAIKYGGGGHKNAAGYDTSIPLLEIKKQILEETKNIFNENI